MKLLAEIIRDLFWDGGLKQMCSKCGIEGELNQWQDIHIMLLSVYESLLEYSIDKHRSLPDNTLNFWDWVHSITLDDNSNEVGLKY